MRRILSWLLQLVLLVAATFVFIVLYAHGPSDFIRNARWEFGQMASWVKGGTRADFPPPK